MDILTIILAGFTLASILGTIAASFYGVRSKTIITTLRESNDAYKERNLQLEEQIKNLTAQYSKDIAELKGRVDALAKMKTPEMRPLIELVTTQHTEVMAAIAKGKK